MSFDRQDFEHAAAEAKKPEDRRTLRQMYLAALSAEQVTGDPAWDQYVGYLEKQITAARETRAASIAKLSDPQLVSPEKIALLRNGIIQLDEQIRVLSWAASLPAAIKGVGEKAKERLDKLTSGDMGEGKMSEGIT